MDSWNFQIKQRIFGQIIKFSPYPKAIVDKEFRYVAVSDEWYKTYGLEGEEIIGKSHYDFFPEVLEHTEWLQIHKKALSGETIQNQRDEFQRQDGSVQYLEWLVTPWYKDQDEKEIGGVIMYTKDITEKVEYEQKIEKYNQDLEDKVRERTKELKSANQNLESFSYSVSHDLRAPLRAINGFSQILEEEYETVLDEEGKRLLSIIQKNSKKMGELIDDVLEFSRVGREQKEEDELIDMKWMTKQVISEVSREYKKHKINAEVGNLPEIRGILPMIRQLMENLISNAFKYSSKNEVIELEIGYKPGDTSNHHTFYVQDNGIGLDMKYADKVFGVFERLHSEKSFSGTGVGLAIAKKIVEKHNGKIWVQSEKGKGSTFFFTIPKK